MRKYAGDILNIVWQAADITDNLMLIWASDQADTFVYPGADTSPGHNTHHE